MENADSNDQGDAPFNPRGRRPNNDGLFEKHREAARKRRDARLAAAEPYTVWHERRLTKEANESAGHE